jgi:hypothetical protein
MREIPGSQRALDGGTRGATADVMTSRLSRTVASASVAVALLAASAVAHADDQTSPDYAQKPATTEYPAPLSQTTQPSYVPQSVALSGPAEIKNYNEGDPIPPGYKPVERVRRGAVIAGGSVFAGLYFLSALVAAGGADSSEGSNPVAALWVPGVGPFIQMVSTDSAVANVFLAIDGVGQSLGLAMVIYGLTSPKTVLVRNDLASADKPKIRAVPMTGNGTTGMALVGTF